LSIPSAVRSAVWIKYIGDDIAKSKCYIGCGNDISVHNFSCGHVIPKSSSGNIQIDNLRPICTKCNCSMNCMNIVDFDIQYGINSKILIENNNNDNIIHNQHVNNNIEFSKLNLTNYLKITNLQKNMFTKSIIYYFDKKWIKIIKPTLFTIKKILIDIIKKLNFEKEYIFYEMLIKNKQNFINLLSTFIDEEFEEKLDNNLNLLGFNNGIY